MALGCCTLLSAIALRKQRTVSDGSNASSRNRSGLPEMGIWLTGVLRSLRTLSAERDSTSRVPIAAIWALGSAAWIVLCQRVAARIQHAHPVTHTPTLRSPNSSDDPHTLGPIVPPSQAPRPLHGATVPGHLAVVLDLEELQPHGFHHLGDVHAVQLPREHLCPPVKRIFQPKHHVEQP